MSAVPTVFEGEVQLLRWSETSNQGATITLQLSDPSDLERFKTMTLAKGKQAGQRLMAAMVEIGDDERPVARAEAPKEKPGQLCVMAVNFCKDPMFRQFIGLDDEEEAKDYITSFCGITSRKELDSNKRAADQFLKFIRAPFLTWRDAQ